MKPFIKTWIILAVGILTYFILPESCPEPARRMSFVFVVAAAFWAFEVIPLYATSLAVVLLEIFILSDIKYTTFLAPFASPVIMLFFGGFILANALHKYNVDNLIARKLIRAFGQKPFMVQLGFMCTTAFLSMWMSNTATTAMMLIMVRPLLAQLDSKDPFRMGLVLSIAFGANIGGVGTPVGTPPNAIALGLLADKGIHLGFLSWMFMAVPLVIVILVATALILNFFFPSSVDKISFQELERKKFDWRAKSVAALAVFTIILWLTSALHQMPNALVALLSAGLFFAFQFLDKKDLQGIDWDILILMWGGLALGKGMEVSGLTTWLLSLPVFHNSGLILLAAFCALGMTLSTFISNTATANLLIPIAISIPGENTVLLAVVVALCCSFAMAFPISTPPNAMAFSTNTLRSKDMFKAGFLVSFIALILIFLGSRIIIPRIFGA